MFGIFKKTLKKRYASNYYDLTNFYCQSVTKPWGYTGYYRFKNIYIEQWGGKKNKVFIADENNKAILVCEIRPIESTSRSGPFSITTIIGTNFKWECDLEEQDKIMKTLNEMDDHLLEKERIKKEEEKEKVQLEEYRKAKKIKELLVTA